MNNNPEYNEKPNSGSSFERFIKDFWNIFAITQGANTIEGWKPDLGFGQRFMALILPFRVDQDNSQNPSNTSEIDKPEAHSSDKLPPA
jgi:hypothetical protein